MDGNWRERGISSANISLTHMKSLSFCLNKRKRMFRYRLIYVRLDDVYVLVFIILVYTPLFFSLNDKHLLFALICN